MTYKVDDRAVLILGGCTKERKLTEEITRSVRTAKVWLFDLMSPGFQSMPNLSEPCMSIYPAFCILDNKSLRLVLLNEDGS